MGPRHTREEFLRLTGGTAAATMATSLGLLTPATAGAQATVPRERTLIMMFGGASGQFLDTGLGNPYVIGASHQIGNNTMWEPLFYYSAFANENIPWLAVDQTWNDDYTGVTITLRGDVTWADGVPFTARDVVFTLNMLKSYAPRLRNSADIADYLASADAPDDTTLQLAFTRPNPRFVYDYLTFKYDTGTYIMPEHIFKDVEDVTSFSFFDLDKGWPFGTGPYRVTLWTPTQKFMDLRPDYWGAKSGFAKLPKAERLIYLPYSDDNRAAQLLVTDQIDSALDLRPGTMKAVLQQSKKITTFSFDKPPYGYVDWWPNSLWFNCDTAPFNDPDVRWAMSYAMDREQLVQVAYEGAGQTSKLPYPDYPPLRPFFSTLQSLLDKYPTNKYDLNSTTRLMQGKGYAKDRDGFWVKDGQRVAADIVGAGAIHADIGPIIAEQLRRGGFDASFSNPTDAATRRANGDAKVFITGHGGSIADPHLTLTFFHSRNYRPNGQNVPGNALSRWRNPDFDAIVDQMALVPMGDPRLLDLFPRAMEIWLRELPNAPLIQWFHRIPNNETYWTGWPTILNSYLNGAHWHLTFPLIMQRLQPQK
jgi:peptide/nickel transport system substrate-binding protein